MKLIAALIVALLSLACRTSFAQDRQNAAPAVTLHVLGTIQDGGSPHMGCKKDCCKELFVRPDKDRMVVSLGVIDHATHNTYILEATPDFARQAKALNRRTLEGHNEAPDGIFLTHAHIGHYTGLMFLGKEALNADAVPVYAMPRMKAYLESNGPWSQLVKLKNISMRELSKDQEVRLTPALTITPFTVPHRDEFSETVGYTISGPRRKALFIPDIDKWEKWETNIIDAIARVDYAFIDGTFYDGAEIGNRDISTIPHPFIIESMRLFKDLPAAERKKVYFIHFNHTNPVITKNSNQFWHVISGGFNVAEIGQEFKL